MPLPRLALIGLGSAVGPHAKSLMDLADRATVVAAVTRSAERARLFASHFPFPVSRDVDAVLADRSIDAVLILTPPNSHRDLVEKAAAAGKHVLVEKPLATTLADSRALVAAMRAAKRRLGVTLQFRFRPASMRLKAAIDGGELGAIAAASLTVPWWRPQAYYDQPGRGTRARDGGGVLITQAVHALDLFRSLVGVSRVVAAQAATTPVHRMETEDFAAALVRLGDGAPGVIQATTAACPGAAEHLEIMGAKATAWLTGGDLRIVWHDGREETITARAGTGGGANIMDFPHDWHRDLIADFLDAIRDDRDPAVTGEEALATQELIETILAAPQ